MKHVLPAYHSGRPGRDVLAWARLLQRALPATVDVVAMYEGHNDKPTDQWFEHIRARLGQSNPAKCRFLRPNGQPASEISAVADEREADLISMGGHRHQGLAQWVAVSTMDRLLRSTPLPVPVV